MSRQATYMILEALKGDPRIGLGFPNSLATVPAKARNKRAAGTQLHASFITNICFGYAASFKLNPKPHEIIYVYIYNVELYAEAHLSYSPWWSSRLVPEYIAPGMEMSKWWWLMSGILISLNQLAQNLAGHVAMGWISDIG